MMYQESMCQAMDDWISSWKICSYQVSYLSQKALLKVVMLIFLMFLYIHFSCCIWNYTVTIEEEWIPNMDFIWFGVPQVYDYYITDDARRFWICLYIGFYLFGVGEVCPRT